MGNRKSILIVGIGNEYRRDDGIGVAVARHLRSIMGENDAVDIVEVTDASNIIDMMMEMDYKKMIVIDALYSHTIGEVYRFRKEVLLNMDQHLPHPSSTHAMDIVEAIRLAETLGIAEDMEVVMLCVGCKDFGLGKGLSRELEESMESIVEEVIKEMNVMGDNRCMNLHS
ncbi:hypothetical protein HRbin04_00975 [archaeon HR04]|nr:hypothetical protein HRbin04_00975 [archaeon HR04]